MKRKFLAMTLALAMGLSLAACGGGSASTPAPAESGVVEATTPAETRRTGDLITCCFL